MLSSQQMQQVFSVSELCPLVVHHSLHVTKLTPCAKKMAKKLVAKNLAFTLSQKEKVNTIVKLLLKCFVEFSAFCHTHFLLFFPSYKSCLPKSHSHDIQKRNRLDRYRIRNSLKRFLKKVGNCSIDECSLKLKYLIELAAIEPSLGSETFMVDQSSSNSKSTFSLIRVSGEIGIQTSGSCHQDDALVRTN